ncbi:MOSC domain-containing protein [Moelleriella libera RCEF 2490]|uniref:MOSC domain-containing protein n=1 Tax=Moelleriella libera RCEF 2490 TaxID=1081109 RepID=A0A168ASA0_9HYPO|nr:MOSC domain-containing protein [Moelleriella libera RCEF 2490]
MTYCTRDITKETVTELEPVAAPVGPGTVLQLRAGYEIQTLTPGVPSGIFKSELRGPVYIGATGLPGDRHSYFAHGGTDRAVLQYDADHYADWRQEECPRPALFDAGGFGENIVSTGGWTEATVCVGDAVPALVVPQRQEGPAGEAGGAAAAARADHGRAPDRHGQGLRAREAGQGAEALRCAVSTRVRLLTFALREPVVRDLPRPAFDTFAFAQIQFGGDDDDGHRFKRSYSIVAGDMNQFSLGVALDDHSRGGSAYLHQTLRVGDDITMAPGGSPRAVEDEERCVADGLVARRLVIIGGIGVTAFLPLLPVWDARGYDYEVHYASQARRLNLEELITAPPSAPAQPPQQKQQREDEEEGKKEEGGRFTTRIYCCGPSGLMDAAERRARQLGYPEHMLHFESFGADAGGPRGDPFRVQVHEVDTHRRESLDVPPDKSLLRVLRETGFEITSLCEAGGCGACKVNLCAGRVVHNGTGLFEAEKASTMLSCVDRGIGSIEIELD